MPLQPGRCRAPRRAKSRRIHQSWSQLLSMILSHHPTNPLSQNTSKLVCQRVSICFTLITDVFEIAHSSSPLPKINVSALFNTPRPSFSPDPDTQTISVDVLAVVGNTASPVSRDTHVFYDSEILAIIHRFKAQSSGLVSTHVWAWHGARCQIGEREERKLQELAKRYGTALV